MAPSDQYRTFGRIPTDCQKNPQTDNTTTPRSQSGLRKAQIHHTNVSPQTAYMEAVRGGYKFSDIGSDLQIESDPIPPGDDTREEFL